MQSTKHSFASGNFHSDRFLHRWNALSYAIPCFLSFYSSTFQCINLVEQFAVLLLPTLFGRRQYERLNSPYLGQWKIIKKQPTNHHSDIVEMNATFMYPQTNFFSNHIWPPIEIYWVIWKWKWLSWICETWTNFFNQMRISFLVTAAIWSGLFLRGYADRVVAPNPTLECFSSSFLIRWMPKDFAQCAENSCEGYSQRVAVK